MYREQKRQKRKFYYILIIHLICIPIVKRRISFSEQKFKSNNKMHGGSGWKNNSAKFRKFHTNT